MDFSYSIYIIHGIEIYLKGLIAQIRVLEKIRNCEYQEEKFEGNHNILQLCNTAMSLIKNSSQKELISEFKFIKKYIEILYSKTNDMTFARYPQNKEHLPQFYVNQSSNITIDLDVLRIWVNKVFTILDNCTGYVDYQIDEIKEWLYEVQQYDW